MGRAHSAVLPPTQGGAAYCQVTATWQERQWPKVQVYKLSTSGTDQSPLFTNQAIDSALLFHSSACWEVAMDTPCLGRLRRTPQQGGQGNVPGRPCPTRSVMQPAALLQGRCDRVHAAVQPQQRLGMVDDTAA